MAVQGILQYCATTKYACHMQNVLEDKLLVDELQCLKDGSSVYTFKYWKFSCTQIVAISKLYTLPKDLMLLSNQTPCTIQMHLYICQNLGTIRLISSLINNLLG